MNNSVNYVMFIKILFIEYLNITVEIIEHRLERHIGMSFLVHRCGRSNVYIYKVF